MTKINEASKIILDKLWELAERNGGYFKLNNNPTYMPLSIEKLGKTVISICHYGEQNGDLMRDPEMLFWKDENGDYFPFYFRNDYTGFEEFAGEVAGGKLTVENTGRQRMQVDVANVLTMNIKHQQELA